MTYNHIHVSDTHIRYTFDINVHGQNSVCSSIIDLTWIIMFITYIYVSYTIHRKVIVLLKKSKLKNILFTNKQIKQKKIVNSKYIKLNKYLTQ